MSNPTRNDQPGGWRNNPYMWIVLFVLGIECVMALIIVLAVSGNAPRLFIAELDIHVFVASLLVFMVILKKFPNLIRDKSNMSAPEWSVVLVWLTLTIIGILIIQYAVIPNLKDYAYRMNGQQTTASVTSIHLFTSHKDGNVNYQIPVSDIRLADGENIDIVYDGHSGSIALDRTNQSFDTVYQEAASTHQLRVKYFRPIPSIVSPYYSY
jgi:hypothetical protein